MIGVTAVVWRWAQSVGGPAFLLKAANTRSKECPFPAGCDAEARPVISGHLDLQLPTPDVDDQPDGQPFRLRLISAVAESIGYDG